MSRLPPVRRLVTSALAVVTTSLLTTASAHSQSRPFWEELFAPNNSAYTYRPKRKSDQYGSGYVRQPGGYNGQSRSYSSSAAARAAATRSARLADDDDDDEDGYQRKPPMGPKLLDGGPRPDISSIPPRPISIATGQPAGTIVIDTKGRQLLLVTGSGSALRYPISVGREGFTWTGTEKISRIADWPDWHPPAEMRERDPRLPEKMTGGVRNPLGAKSLYLGNSLYRIHGTNDARTIGLAASSGCFRMLNGHVVDLANRVGVGTKVVVLPYLGASPVKTAAPDSTSGSRPQSRQRTSAVNASAVR